MINLIKVNIATLRPVHLKLHNNNTVNNYILSPQEKASLTSCNKTCDRRQVINISPSSSEEKTPEPTTQSSLQGCDETLSGDAPASVVVDSCRGLVSGSGSAEKTVKLAAELNVYVDDDVSANNTHQGDET